MLAALTLTDVQGRIVADAQRAEAGCPLWPDDKTAHGLSWTPGQDGFGGEDDGRFRLCVVEAADTELVRAEPAG